MSNNASRVHSADSAGTTPAVGILTRLASALPARRHKQATRDYPHGGQAELHIAIPSVAFLREHVSNTALFGDGATVDAIEIDHDSAELVAFTVRHRISPQLAGQDHKLFRIARKIDSILGNRHIVISDHLSGTVRFERCSSEDVDGDPIHLRGAQAPPSQAAAPSSGSAGDDAPVTIVLNEDLCERLETGAALTERDSGDLRDLLLRARQYPIRIRVAPAASAATVVHEPQGAAGAGIQSTASTPDEQEAEPYE